MKVWIWLELKTKIKNDLDLQEETFISDEELIGYANEAIDDAETEIMRLYDQYLETTDSITLSSGVSDYSLPSDIYATKITNLFYNNGSEKYPIRQIKDLNEVAFVQDGEQYRFRIINTSANGLQLRLYPTPQEDGSNITIWYVRNAKRIDVDTDTLDLPEAANYVLQHIKVRCYEKEGNPKYQGSVADREAAKQRLIDTLTDMVPDGDNFVQADVSFYDDFYSHLRGW